MMSKDMGVAASPPGCQPSASAASASSQSGIPNAGGLIRREDVLRLCAEKAELHANLALEGLPDQARVREAMEAMATAIRHQVALMPDLPCACSFCGAAQADQPTRVLVHDNGAAICATCVAAAVLSFADHAASAMSAETAETAQQAQGEGRQRGPSGSEGDAHAQ